MFLNHSILNRTDEYIQNNLVELHVYLSQHTIEHIIEQPAYELGDLASDLGGVLTSVRWYFDGPDEFISGVPSR
jgi:hypothetical protein